MLNLRRLLIASRIRLGMPSGLWYTDVGKASGVRLFTPDGRLLYLHQEESRLHDLCMDKTNALSGFFDMSASNSANHLPEREKGTNLPQRR